MPSSRNRVKPGVPSARCVRAGVEYGQILRGRSHRVAYVFHTDCAGLEHLSLREVPRLGDISTSNSGCDVRQIGRCKWI